MNNEIETRMLGVEVVTNLKYKITGQNINLSIIYEHIFLFSLWFVYHNG